MPYIVVKNENGTVLSRPEPYGPLAWLDIGVSKATDYRYAITFDTFAGASKCGAMQGGRVCGIGADTPPPVVFRSLFTDWVGDCGIDSGVVEVVDG